MRVFVTGATGFIGSLRAAGAPLVLVGRNRARLGQLAAALDGAAE